MGNVQLGKREEDIFAVSVDFEAPEHEASGTIRVSLQPGEDGMYSTEVDVHEPEPGLTVFKNHTEADNRGMIDDERRLAMGIAYAVQRAKDLAEFSRYRNNPSE
jgi:hypothetical protein